MKLLNSGRRLLRKPSTSANTLLLFFCLASSTPPAAYAQATPLRSDLDTIPTDILQQMFSARNLVAIPGVVWNAHCAVGAKSGVVAGMWPWMRQGWTYLDHPTDVGSRLIRGGLVDLRSGLMRSRFTTFEKEAGLAAAEIIGLRSRDAVENMHEGGEGELER